MLTISTAPALPESLRQGIEHAVQRFNNRCAIPSLIANIRLEHDEDYFDMHWRFIGEYRLVDAAILLNTGREPEETLLAMFWHEYAHHVYYTLFPHLTPACTLLFDELRTTDGYKYAEIYDRQENGTYWTSETELWARLLGQYFVLVSESERDYQMMMQMLEEVGMQQWSYSEMMKLKPLLEYVLVNIGFLFIPLHGE
jgi:hypothetical protein